jgi:tetratricopeptide (TPR) repeat protein
MCAMTDDLYERYKEALRLGHVAVLRGALEGALEAYRAAAVIAPSRALPHTSLGGVLLRLGHLEEALVEYAAAVARAPHDEGALLGQAEALTIAGQRVDAALALDHVSEIQEASGRLPEAADTLRRALELEDAPERTRRQRGLLREIRLSAGDAAAEKLLARALRLRDEPVGDELEPARPAMTAAPIGGPADKNLRPAAEVANEIPFLSAGETLEMPGYAGDSAAADSPEEAVAAATVEAGSTPSAEPVEVFVTRPATEVEWPKEDRAPTAAARARAVERAPWPTAEPEPVPMTELVPEPERVEEAAQQDAPAVGVMEGAFDTAAMGEILGDTEHQPTGDELLASAEAADQAGDSAKLRSLLVWTARAYGREGRFEAGLDATHRLLQSDPSNVDAHLALVELYLARGWNALAAEKLVLLGRLADLDDDQETRKRLCAVASRAFPDDEHLATLCA